MYKNRKETNKQKNKQKNNWKSKLERTITSLFLPVSKNRGGECIDCGECCRLPNECSFLEYDEKGKSYCNIYRIRPLNCRKYPRSYREHLTEDTCGFYFESEENDVKKK